MSLGAVLGCAVMILVSAVWVVTLRNLFRAALSLGLVLIGVAALFLLLHAEFLAWVQILVYVGAILTLIVFVIMLTGKQAAFPDEPVSRRRWPAAVACALLFLVLARATGTFVGPLEPRAPVLLSALGQALVTTLLLPFEVVTLVLVAAMVGAIALATRRDAPPGG